jgi:hypothetical protein
MPVPQNLVIPSLVVLQLQYLVTTMIAVLLMIVILPLDVLIHLLLVMIIMNVQWIHACLNRGAAMKNINAIGRMPVIL